MKIPKKILTLVLKIITGIMTAALFAAVCFVLIMAHPQPDKEKSSGPQPLLTASPALNISSEADFAGLVESFPVPVPVPAQVPVPCWHWNTAHTAGCASA